MEAKDYIRAIRKAGFTQAQIAERTGIPQPSVSKIERGDVSDVMSRNYRALQSLHDEVVPKEPQAQAPAASKGARNNRRDRQDKFRNKPAASPKGR